MTTRSPRFPLITGGLAAVLASVCCLGPLVLILLGVSGAWIGNLIALEPFRPWFISAAVIALLFVYRSIFRSKANCEPGEVCAVPRVRRLYKALFWLVAALVVIAIAFPYVLPLLY